VKRHVQALTPARLGIAPAVLLKNWDLKQLLAE